VCDVKICAYNVTQRGGFRQDYILTFTLSQTITFCEGIRCSKLPQTCEISGFRQGVNEIFTLLGCYETSIGSYRCFGTTHRSHLQGLSSLRKSPICCSETSIPKYQTWRKTSQKSEDLIVEILEILKIQRARCFLSYSLYGLHITDPITLRLEVRVSTSSTNTQLLDTFSHYSSLYQLMYLNFSRLQIIMNVI
jgi:hypothetical protein